MKLDDKAETGMYVDYVAQRIAESLKPYVDQQVTHETPGLMMRDIFPTLKTIAIEVILKP